MRGRRGRRTVAVAVAAALMFTAAACGDDDDGDGDGDDAAATTTTEVVVGDEDGPGGSAPTETWTGPEGGFDENIIGGTEESIADYPWVVALRVPGQRDNFCGGALVDVRYVMTAAHCVVEDEVVDDELTGRVTINRPSTIEVISGRDVVDGSGGRVVGVRTVYVAKAYDTRRIANDFAVLELASPINATPVAMAKPNETGYWRLGQGTRALGWGCEYPDVPRGEPCEREELSPLKSAILTVQPKTVCTYEGLTTDASSECMKPTPTDRTCYGDSGGPWIITDAEDGLPRLVGVTSWGKPGCGEGSFSVTGRVAVVVNDARWFTRGIWNNCTATTPNCTVG